jgi:hypothetical protein
MPSRVKEKLEELGDIAAKKWLRDKVGAAIVFDNEAGWVTVALSDEAEKEFSSVAINMLLRDPVVATRKKGISPDKLEAAAMVLVNGLTDLKQKSEREYRRQARVRNAFLGLLVLAGILGGVLYASKARSSTVSESAPKEL